MKLRVGKDDMTLNNTKDNLPVIRIDNTSDYREFYNTEAGVRHYSYRGLYEKEATAFSYIPAAAKVLDIGCGAGRTTS